MSGREDRRGEILGLMHEALEARVRTRRIVRGVGALLVIGAVVVGLRAVRVGGAGSVREEKAPLHAAAEPARPGEVTVNGAGDSVARKSVVKVTVVQGVVVPGGVYVDDAQLEGLLREAGQPVGLIRVAGKKPVVLSEVALIASTGR